MTIKFILTLSILFTTITSFFAQGEEFRKIENIDNLKLELQTVANKTNSIKNTFVQEKHLWMLEEVIISEGLFLFKKPGNVLWKYISPINYSISIFNNNFSINNDGKISSFDINSNPMFGEINNMILTAIRGDFIDNSDFSSKFLENNLYIKAVLTPVNEKVGSMITSIEILFSKNNLQVSQVKFLEPGDDFTLIKFENTEVNIDLPDNSFNIGNIK